jgi:hypothetical protein
LSVHSNFGLNRITISDTLHEDVHASPHAEVTSLGNLQATFIAMVTLVSTIKSQRPNSGEYSRIITLCVHVVICSFYKRNTDATQLGSVSLSTTSKYLSVCNIIYSFTGAYSNRLRIEYSRPIYISFQLKELFHQITCILNRRKFFYNILQTRITVLSGTKLQTSKIQVTFPHYAFLSIQVSLQIRKKTWPLETSWMISADFQLSRFFFSKLQI